MNVRILLLAGFIAFAGITNAFYAREHESSRLSTLSAKAGERGGGPRSREEPMKPTYDDIVKWMKAYFDEYNASAQNANTVHRMDTYFAPDFTFIPYMYVFGGPQNAIKGREAFYGMLTGHPSDYEKLVVHDIFVDEKRLAAVAFLEATVYETATDRIKVKKDYLSLYELKLDDQGALKIAVVHFFWEALPPEIDGSAYAVDKSKWGSQR